MKEVSTLNDILTMSDKELIDYAKSIGKLKDLKEIAMRKTIQSHYPRIKVESEKHPGKNVSKADKTRPTIQEEKPITLLEVKSTFAKEILGLKTEKKETFRDRILNAE